VFQHLSHTLLVNSQIDILAPQQFSNYDHFLIDFFLVVALTFVVVTVFFFASSFLIYSSASLINSKFSYPLDDDASAPLISHLPSLPQFGIPQAFDCAPK
jgi:hypothetical protein